MIRAAWIASLVAGVGLMLPFESDVTLTLGLLCLGAFIVLGVAVIAPPAITSDSASAGDGTGGAADQDETPAFARRPTSEP